jgi:hypothetical protein
MSAIRRSSRYNDQKPDRVSYTEKGSAEDRSRTRRRNDLVTDPVSQHIEDELGFYDELYHGATRKGKVAPLFDPREDKIRVRTLEHMNIVHLRRRIAVEVADMKHRHQTDYDQMELVGDLLHRYSTYEEPRSSQAVAYLTFTNKKDLADALRDLRFMLEKTSHDDNVADFLRKLFYIGVGNDAAILKHVGLLPLDRYPRNKSYPVLVSNYTGFGGYTQQNNFRQENLKNFVKRLQMAIFGGLTLIIPMLIMRLHPTLLTQLLTASVSILIFGVLLAWFLQSADSRDIASATAAYAAVLVVFVGTSSTSTV